MLIDWFTVVAQVINFLILMGLLKYFLYNRILRAMDEREQHLASLRLQAETKESEATQEAESHRRAIQKLEEERNQILTLARQAADQHQRELIQQARQEVDDTRRNWYESIEHEQSAFLEDLRRRTVTQVYEIARRALKDLANEDFEQHLVDVFLSRLQNMEESQWKILNESIQNGQTLLEVLSAFPLSPSMEKKIVSALQERLGETVNITFNVSSSVIGGIELKGAGHTVAWNLEEYLDSLHDNITQALDQRRTTSLDLSHTQPIKGTLA